MANQIKITRERRYHLGIVGPDAVVPMDERSRRVRRLLQDAGLLTYRDGRYLLTVKGRRRMEHYDNRAGR